MPAEKVFEKLLNKNEIIYDSIPQRIKTECGALSVVVKMRIAVLVVKTESMLMIAVFGIVNKDVF